MKNWFKHSLRLLKHEFRRGELTIIALAIILAVSAVYSLTGFSGQIKQGLIANSAKFIAADRVLSTSRVVNEDYLTKSDELGISRAKQVEMSSMIFADDNMLLATVKAVTIGYPLRGELLVEIPDVDTEKHVTQIVSAPVHESVWVEQKILNQLKVSVGGTLDIGMQRFTIAGVISQIPDASFSIFTQGPIVILNFDDLAMTQLVQPGSRLNYKYLFAGDNDALNSFGDWLTPQLNDTQRWTDIKSQQSPLAQALNRAEQYLSLASMLGIILASVAVSVASRRYGQRHQSTVAIFKAMGASVNHITKVYLLHWTLLCLFSISIGLLLGQFILQLGLWAIDDLFDVTLQASNIYPLMVAIFTGVLCVIAFAIHPFKALINTSAMVVLRGNNVQPSFSTHGKQSSKFAKFISLCRSSLIPLLAIFLLLYTFSQNLTLTFALLLGGIAVSAILLLLGQLLMNLGRKVGTQAGKSWHLALANLKRRATENAIQLVSFTIAIKLLLLIVVMKTAIIDEWQQQLPNDVANRFLININQQQLPSVEAFFDEHQLTSSGLSAVVRGRLVAVNDETVTQRVSKEEDDPSDGRQGVGRELNLTWQAELPLENEIVAGQWWPDLVMNSSEQQPSIRNEVSVEYTLAKRLNIVMDDQLTFLLGSEEVKVKVTSIRKANWQSFRPNFFMIFHQSVLSDFPATYISSFHIPEDKKLLLQTFLIEYPTISMLDVDAMISQLKEVIEQVSIAIQFILVLVVLAGSLVLIAQVQASMEERERELAILRTLGAKGRILTASIFYEFVALGLLAGLMASMAMELAVFILQTQVFKMSVSFHFEYWLLGMIAGASFVGLIGLFSCWRLLNLSSVTLIRRTM
jgi:putative ABC transport system permease protein